MYKLVTEHREQRREFILEKGVYSLGRSPDNDIHIPDSFVSRHHMKLYIDDDGIYVEDLGSANGTLVNGEKIKGKVRLKKGDLIFIGEHRLTFIPIETQVEQETTFTTDNPSFYVLYQLGKILLHSNTLDEILESAMDLIFQVIAVETIFIFSTGESKDIEFFKSKTGYREEDFISPFIKKYLTTLKEPEIIYNMEFFRNIKIPACCMLLVPLKDDEEFLGGIVLINSKDTSHRFNSSDKEIMMAVANMVAIGIKLDRLKENIKREAILRSNLERFHSPDVVNLILKEASQKMELGLEVKKVEATVLFSDIKDFTALSEKLTPEEIADLLNSYFDRMTEIVFKHKGSVNKYIGDAIMAIFGTPFSYGNDAKLAVQTAIEMLEALEDFNRNISEEKRFQIRIGINTGLVVAGNIGSRNRMEYTVLGDTVNVASRLEHAAAPNSILVGQRTYEYTKDYFEYEDVGFLELKGKSTKVKAYRVVI